MSDAGRKAHWENVYTTKGEREVNWFHKIPQRSRTNPESTPCRISIDATP